MSIPKTVANKVLTNLDTAASKLEELVKSGKADPKLASVIREIDSFADRFQKAAFGEQSFKSHQAKVLKRDSDEKFMDTFDNPNKVLQADPDEPFMHKTGPTFSGKGAETFDCDNSSAVSDRDEHTVRDLSQWSDSTKKQPSWTRGPAGKSTRQGSQKNWSKLHPMLRIAFVDDPLNARDFNSGDLVRKAGTRDFVLTPYIGKVLYSNTATGCVSVQWPWGVESEAASSLVKDVSGDYAPTSIDQSYSTWESAAWSSSKDSVKEDAKWRKSLASELVTEFEDSTLPIWRQACREWHVGSNELEALSNMEEACDEYGFDTVRRTISNLYSHAHHIAIYWKDSKRRYKVTQREKESKRFSCPRCKFVLKPRTYTQGRRLLQCKSCGFSIAPRDLR